MSFFAEHPNPTIRAAFTYAKEYSSQHQDPSTQEKALRYALQDYILVAVRALVKCLHEAPQTVYTESDRALMIEETTTSLLQIGEGLKRIGLSEQQIRSLMSSPEFYSAADIIFPEELENPKTV